MRARRAAWGEARSGTHLGMFVCAGVFLIVPPIYLFDTFVPLLIGAPIIVVVVGRKALALLGGGMDRLYDVLGRAARPLGLALVEHPSVMIAPRFAIPPFPSTAQARMVGTLVLEGARHGRPVSVRMPATWSLHDPSEVRVGGGAQPFSFRARDGRMKADKDAPPQVLQALERVPNSTRWNGLRGGADEDGIVVSRRAVRSGDDWMLDLWLAERLADALSSPR